MPEHIRALVVILCLALVVFALARAPIREAGLDEATFRRHCAAWLAVTIIAFLSHSFWLATALCAVALFSAGSKEQWPLSIYFFVLFAFPHFTELLPGFGPIENIFAVNHIRTLNLVVLLPVAVSLFRSKDHPPTSFTASDCAVLGFLLIQLVAQALDDSLIGTLRTGFYLVVDIWLPYYVASRAINSLGCFRQIAAALLVATVILALTAVFESARHWLLYESLRRPLGIPIGLPMYLLRGEGGPLRANVSVGNSIVLGYVIMVGLGMYMLLAPRLKPRWRSIVAAVCLVAGLGASLSRGPWVGATVMTLILVLLGPGLGKRLIKAIAAGGIAMAALSLSPFGQRFIDLLPFVGRSEAGTIDYRSRLFEVSSEVFLQKPLFGDLHFLENPIMEQMRQGQGIIDMVNTYLQIALPYGAFGLLFFLGALLLPMRAVWRARRRIMYADPEAERLGRVLLGIMVGIMVTIATVSSIGVIPTMYWLMVGLCVSYARVASQAPEPKAGRVAASFPVRLGPRRTKFGSPNHSIRPAGPKS